MAEKTYFVKKGWLIAKDAFGNMLPFFLHVRDKDIVWLSDNDEFISTMMKTKDISDITEIKPTTILNFKSGRWDVDVDRITKKCTMRTCIDFTADSFDLNSTRDHLSAQLSLPLSLVNNHRLNMQCTIGTEAENLSFSSVTINKLYDGVTGLVHNVSLHIRNQAYKFPVNYYELDDYKFSCVYVTITGEFQDE